MVKFKIRRNSVKHWFSKKNYYKDQTEYTKITLIHYGFYGNLGLLFPRLKIAVSICNNAQCTCFIRL